MNMFNFLLNNMLVYDMINLLYYEYSKENIFTY